MTDEQVDEVGNEDVPAHDAELLEALKDAFAMATEIEPVAGKATFAQVDKLRVALEEVAELIDAGLAATAEDQRDAARDLIAVVHARCAAVAIAANDERHAGRWLAEAERFAADPQLRDELVAARKHHERYRKLVHGRNLIAHEQESAARKLWNELVKAGADDAITRAAVDELEAPRPLGNGYMPSLWSYNGFGLGFSGKRDAWSDGSYATTHCITALFIPLFPLRAFRVAADGDGYIVMAREQLSAFAKIARLVVLASIVVGITALVLHNHYNDPTRLARIHFDESVETAAASQPEAALRSLDGALASDELWRIDAERAQRAGAEVVRLTVGFVAKPFQRDNLDQAGRLVRRYRALPAAAQGGVARDAVIAALDGWIQQLGELPDTAEARFALLRHAADVAPTPQLAARITTMRLAVATAMEADWPLEALAILVDQPTAETTAKADKIVERLADSPSLLADAGKTLGTWTTYTTAHELRARAESQRLLATNAQAEADAEALTAAELAAMATRRPWDQRVVLRQARDEASAGKLDVAAARLAKLGKPGMMIRDARMLLGQLSSALGKLDQADLLLTSLLGSRLERYVAASAKLEEAAKAAQERVTRQLDTGSIPLDLQRKYDALSDETARRELIQAWITESIGSDGAVMAAREVYLELSDIVPVSLAAGTVKLRRAQALPEGAPRNAMLVEAERTFLSIRNEAEGQPEFRLGLGEIYARLGKTKESEAEFAALLEKREPVLMLQVASTYRSIGSVERAKRVASDVFAHPASATPHKNNAAVLLGLLTTGDDESEGWFRKADQSDPFVRTSLLEIEGRLLLRQGKRTECAAKFAQAAKEHMATAGAMRTDGYNNAAIAQLSRFACSGDRSALAEAEAALEKAYLANREVAIVVGNFADVLAGNGRLRVLGKRIDLRAFQPTSNEVDALLGKLLDSPEREAVLAELAADPGVRRGDQVFAEYEVLAPNSARAYRQRFAQALERRDETAAAAIVERARRAKGLDVSEAARTREKWLSGAADAEFLEANASNLARLESLAANPKLDAKTRATVYFLIARAAPGQGLFKSDVALLRRGHEAAVQAMKLWPSLDVNTSIIGGLLDEAGLAADAKAWFALRRERTAIQALAKLASDGSPTFATIKSSKQWGELIAYTRADRSRPGLDDLRLARLLGDAALETRARPVLDDKLARLSDELELVLDPGSPDAKEDLAYFDRR